MPKNKVKKEKKDTKDHSHENISKNNRNIHPTKHAPSIRVR
jgi:hypothetical protein